jgi:hypothetical protein
MASDDYDRRLPCTYNITNFDPNDPVIVSETEIYCSTDYRVRDLIKKRLNTIDWLIDRKQYQQPMY